MSFKQQKTIEGVQSELHQLPSTDSMCQPA